MLRTGSYSLLPSLRLMRRNFGDKQGPFRFDLPEIQSPGAEYVRTAVRLGFQIRQDPIPDSCGLVIVYSKSESDVSCQYWQVVGDVVDERSSSTRFVVVLIEDRGFEIDGCGDACWSL